jgi:tRNA(Ile2) C34 agmatinyltransferase TiaS
MSISICERCGGKAIIHGYDGSWRCVVCTPKEFKWNNKTMKYE